MHYHIIQKYLFYASYKKKYIRYAYVHTCVCTKYKYFKFPFIHHASTRGPHSLTVLSALQLAKIGRDGCHVARNTLFL